MENADNNHGDRKNTESVKSKGTNEKTDHSDRKSKIHTLCILGSGLSVLAWAVLGGSLIGFCIKNGFFDQFDSHIEPILILLAGIVFVSFTTAIPCSIALIIAMIISICGMIRSLKRKMRGLGFSLTGLIFSWPWPILLVVSLLINFGTLRLTELLVDNFTPPDHNYLTYNGDVEHQDEFVIQRKGRDGEGLTEATLLKYYWNGDPEDTIIRPDAVGQGQTKITSIGYRGSNFSSYHYYGFDISLLNDEKDGKMERIQDPQRELDRYGIEPGTKVIFDEVEFHVIVTPEIRHVVCCGVDTTGDELLPPIFSGSEENLQGYYLIMENADGSVTLYRCCLSFECSDDNEHFCSDENGRLEKKNADDNECFVYVSSELYKKQDGFEPFEMIYEGAPEPSKTYTEERKKDFLFAKSVGKDRACAIKYYWYGDPEDTDIDFSSWSRETIVGYGGEFEGETFCFEIVPPASKVLPGFVLNGEDPREQLSDYGIGPETEVNFEEIEFTMFLTNTIDQVKLPPADNEHIYMALQNEDGTITIYRYYVRFDFSEPDYKYSYRFDTDEEGFLIDKETGEKADIDLGWYKGEMDHGK